MVAYWKSHGGKRHRTSIQKQGIWILEPDCLDPPRTSSVMLGSFLHLWVFFLICQIRIVTPALESCGEEKLQSTWNHAWYLLSILSVYILSSAVNIIFDRTDQYL